MTMNPVHSNISLEEGELLSRLIAERSRRCRWRWGGVRDFRAVHLRGDEAGDP